MSQSAIKTVAIIGLGKMGRPMARHLVAKGFAVHGYDVDAAAARHSGADGVTVGPGARGGGRRAAVRG
jgi:3-hydroxyisobutyrate dehydrogenase-like beta-hydroxyacid dehydrogenase